MFYRSLLIFFFFYLPLSAQFIVHNKESSFAFNVGVNGSWPYTHNDSKRTTPLANTLFGGEFGIDLQWYFLNSKRRDNLLQDSRDFTGFFFTKFFGLFHYSLESSHQVLINFGDEKQKSPMLLPSQQPRRYHGRLAFAMSYDNFFRFQINPLGIGMRAISLGEQNFTTVYVTPLQKISLDLPLADFFIRIEYEGTLLAFAYNFEHRKSLSVADSHNLIGNFSLGFFIPSFYSFSKDNKAYLGFYTGMQIEHIYPYTSNGVGFDWSKGALLSRLQFGFKSWLPSPERRGAIS